MGTRPLVVREELDSDRNKLKCEDELGEGLVQPTLKPGDEATEVVAGGGADGIGGIALAVPEIVPAHPMFGFEMADGRAAGLSRLTLGVTRRFFSEMNTLTCSRVAHRGRDSLCR